MMKHTYAQDDWLMFLIASSLAAACSEGATRIERVEVRDSAGIRIVMTTDAEPAICHTRTGQRVQSS